MPAQIDLATASQLFDTEVTLKYQNHEYLMGTVEERHGTTGDASNVPVSDEIEMSQGSFAPSNIPITPVVPTNVQVVPFDYRVKTAIGGGYKTLFAYDKIVDHSKLHSKAIGRLLDLIKLNAIYLNSSFGSITVIPRATGVNTGVNSGKLVAALAQMENAGVEVSHGSTSIWNPSLIRTSILDDERIVNFFYNSDKPLSKGFSNDQTGHYLGVMFRYLGAAGVNQIPFTTSMSVNTYLVPLVHRECLVQTFNRDPQTSITWLAHEDRYELLSTVTTGANLIQLPGVTLLQSDYPFAENA